MNRHHDAAIWAYVVAVEALVFGQVVLEVLKSPIQIDIELIITDNTQ